MFFLVGVYFVSFYKPAESMVQHMRNCVCKTQTVTTGTLWPPLVASQYRSPSISVGLVPPCRVRAPFKRNLLDHKGISIAIAFSYILPSYGYDGNTVEWTKNHKSLICQSE